MRNIKKTSGIKALTFGLDRLDERIEKERRERKERRAKAERRAQSKASYIQSIGRS